MRRAIIVLAVVLGWGPRAYGLDPALEVSQYAHTAWTIRGGFFKGVISSIAQTPDGYLWLGTEFGLLRFDGIRVVPWQPPGGEHLPSDHIWSLLAARDGTLWVGTKNGLVSWKDGKIKQYAELVGQSIPSLLEDREGTVWVSASLSPGKLCAIRSASVQCFGEDGRFGLQVYPLYEDSRGNLWAGVPKGLWRWKPGPPKFYPLTEWPNGLVEGDSGSLLIATKVGLRQFVDGNVEAYTIPGSGQQSLPNRLLRDRKGGLWIGTFGGGLLHVHQGRADTFVQADGLSSNVIIRFFEDREGNVWVATGGGLDRFRDFPVHTISKKQGLSSAPVLPVLAAADGSVWLGSDDGLNRWNNGRITVYRKRNGLPDNGVAALFQDYGGRIWVSTPRGVAYLENGTFIPVRGVPGGEFYSIAGDNAGNMWIGSHNALFHLLRGSLVERVPWSALGRKSYARGVLSDRLEGGLWLGFIDGGVAYFKDGRVRTSYGVADGLGEGRVNSLQLDRDGTLWAATEGGLSRLKNGHVATLTSKNGLPCDTVHWSMQDNKDSVWLGTACGLVRIAKTDLDAWVSAVDNGDPKRTIRATVFDSSDGVIGGAIESTVAKTAGGELWFSTWDGVSVVDPRNLHLNKLPPPVHIEQVAADRKTYWQNLSGDALSSPPKLPPLVRDLTIDYTALSLVVPEKVRFRVKLEGWDRDWKDAGNERKAFYSNLGPREYRFRVMACNNSGVWNEAGDTLDFSIAPAYWQTNWFRALCVAAFMTMLWLLYQLRLRQVAQQFNLRMEERVNERTRIARDLHDTLLQSFHGLLLRFQAATNLLPERPEEAKRSFESAIDYAAQAITEGRDAVQGLRSSTLERNDLALAINTLGEELSGGETNPDGAKFHVGVEGTPRELHPILRDEVYRIAGEAMRNGFKHAKAGRIEVEIRYDERELRLRVRDDGKGVDPKYIKEDGREGHFGLHGMRERAGLLGGKLTVWSELEAGTEVELRIPAKNAYATAEGGKRSWLVEKLSGKDAETKS